MLRDWTITLPFAVPSGDLKGDLHDAIFEAALKHAPPETADFSGRADTGEGKVWITLTLFGATREQAEHAADAMRQRIEDDVADTRPTDDETRVAAA